MTDVAVRAGDTPRSAYRVLERRATLATVAVLLSLAGVAWWWTVGRSGGMSGMAQGLGQVGAAMPFEMSAGVFLGMWTAMMVAMMFPAVAPIVLLHRMVVRRRGEGVTPTVTFCAGYLLVWAAAGVIPLLVLVGFRHVATGSSWVARASGAVLLLAGAYQFTAWKKTCQRACRTPLTFLVTHDFKKGWRGSARAGVTHGLYCLGCCWALMAVLFVVGLMNLVWMAAITAVFLLEKNWRYGAGLTRVVGTAVLGLGVAVLIHPSLLHSVAPVTVAPMPMHV